MKPDSKMVQDAFLRAMAEGYAQNVKKTTVPEIPNSKAITFVWGDFIVLDCYLTTPYSEKSSGTTTIWYEEQPVWVMHYGGGYAKIAIPFLKSCLHRAYVLERRFYGGRGPKFVRDERFTYINHIEHDSFESFFGIEKIFDLSEQALGHHWYRGMSLL